MNRDHHMNQEDDSHAHVNTEISDHRTHSAEPTEPEEPQYLDNAGKSFDSAMDGRSSDEEWDVPKHPSDLNGVSDSLNSVAGQFQKIPGVSMVTDKDGLFGDVFHPGDTGDTDDTDETDGTDGDYGHSEYITAADSNELPPNVDELLTIDLGDTGSLDKSYLSIAEDLKHYENTYIDCLDKLSDLDFNQTNIDGCVGIDSRYVIDDIDYFKRKILARADSIIRSRMIDKCFKVAGMDLAESAGCDLLQKDAIQLLWAELNFHDLVDYHRNKYTVQAAALPVDLLDTILEEFKELYAKQTDLFVELYNHKTLTVQRVRDYIADRLEYLEDMEEEHGPLEHGPLSLNKIIKVDSASMKLKKLSQLRSTMPLGILDKARKARELTKNAPLFISPWTNSDHHAYGRGPVREALNKGESPKAAETIKVQINAVL